METDTSKPCNFTMDMYHFIGMETTWVGKKSIPDGILNEFEFWVQNIERLNSKALGEPAVPVSASATVYSDASSVACGAVLNIGPKVYTAHKNLSEPDKFQSSTWRELDGVLYALKSFAPILSGRTVNWETDNQAVPIISKNGSNRQHLQTIARDVYYACRNNDIHFNITWVPRDENVIADEVSKFVNYDDCTTSDAFFAQISKEWGLFTIDRSQKHQDPVVRLWTLLRKIGVMMSTG